MSEQAHQLDVCRRPGHCHGSTEYGVGSEPAFVAGPVEPDHCPVDSFLVVAIKPAQSGSDDFVHVSYNLRHPFSMEPPLVAVPQLKGLELPLRRARRDAGSSDGSVGQDLCLHRRVSSRVQHLPRPDRDYLASLLHALQGIRPLEHVKSDSARCILSNAYYRFPSRGFWAGRLARLGRRPYTAKRCGAPESAVRIRPAHLSHLPVKSPSKSYLRFAKMADPDAQLQVHQLV